MSLLLPLLSLLLFLFLFPHPSLSLRPYILITSDDLNPPSDDDQSLLPPSDDFDDFADLNTNPESWRSIFDEDHRLRAVIAAASFGDVAAAVEAAGEVDAAAAGGDAEAQSAAGFLYGMGIGRGRSGGKAVLYHHFAAEGGSLESKMTLAYTYFRQNMYEKSVDLYAELAEMTLASSLISTGPPAIELVRIHIGTEENKEALKKSRGEEYEGFQMVEYQALMGNTEDMYVLGLLYYYGLRGVTRDNEKALHWFSKAAEKREPRAMEFLGEIYARGVGAERNYTKAFQWLKRASEVEDHHSAFNGLGYLYVKGYGVEKNFTKAKEYFEMAANNKDSGGHYNLGVLYLKGIGVKRDVTVACNYFLSAAHSRQPKALYQVAKMFQTGIGLKKNLQRSTYLYKSIAERGPCSSLSRLALESYLKGDLGKALLLYLRLAELGYEVAQSNAAWILDKYGEQSMCMGESGFCTDPERHLRAHLLWWRASEQGNEHAALLIGDAYYYGRGTERDYERAAEAYMHARSQSNAQAIFNLGYMHEHGQGLPLDFHLAKRYYDQALEKDPAAKLPVTLALTSLWIRKNYADTFLVDFIDYLPEVYPAVEEWGEGILMDEGNVTILTLFVCLLTVLYLRDRQRRQRAAPVPPQ